MPDPISGVMAGTAVIGASSARKQGKAANKAAERQGDVADRQMDLADQQWQRYMETFAPLENEMVALAQKPIEPDIARIMADTQQAYSGARASGLRSLQRRGVNPSAGAYQAGSDLFGLNLAAQQVQGINQAYRTADDTRWGRMAAVSSLGRGLPGNAQAGMSAAGNIYGNQAQMYGNAASQAWGAVGNAAQNFFSQPAVQDWNQRWAIGGAGWGGTGGGAGNANLGGWNNY